MSKLPPPPGHRPKHAAPTPPHQDGPGAYSPSVSGPDGKLDDNETSFILRSCLLPKHHNDPNILRFIANYMRCRDNTQAARESGLDPRSGYHIRNKPDIHLAITKLTEKSVNKYGFDASEVVERVKEISNIDPADFLKPDGSYITDLSQIRPEARRAIKRFKAKNLFEKDPNGMPIQVGVLIDVELWDKMKAHEMLGREKELFKETRKVEHDVTSNMKEFLLESRKRAEAAVIDVTPKLQIEGKNE